ncbi:unnamed protein product [Cylicocyclus nassatus]|uniref:Kinesin-like protein n=1 Tax=Cylicocyclus nassatus TaxID=53992 RepID=A0AA36HHW6_CYLNA|nr:unnamed protein product [Cylicocyclus nassatus]
MFFSVLIWKATIHLHDHERCLAFCTVYLDLKDKYRERGTADVDPTVTAPLPDPMRTGRATSAVSLTAARTQDARPPSSTARRSTSVTREDARTAELRTKLLTMEAEVNKLTAENDLMKTELSKKRTELLEKDETNRILNNYVVDLKGQIRVVVRVRPPLGKERDAPITHISYPCPFSIKLDQGNLSQTYNFQRVFGPNVTQARLFAYVEELILSCLHGYNVSIIAYGQTGSGKTFTMRGGDDDSAGVIPRAVRFLFRSRDKLSDLYWDFDFEASFLEVYNEEVYDLLANRNKLEVKIGSGVTVITGLKQRRIVNEEDIETILAVADRTRFTASTKCNEQSIRSHAVFALAIHGTNRTTGVCRSATLHLVDLAGSERVKESGAESDRFKETTYINSALSNLQNCIRSQLNKSTHIPYRNAKLTMLLWDSLGAGNSKTLVIVTLNPAITQAEETKRSLDFAQQMSFTKIGCARKQEHIHPQGAASDKHSESRSLATVHYHNTCFKVLRKSLSISFTLATWSIFPRELCLCAYHFLDKDRHVSCGLVLGDYPEKSCTPNPHHTHVSPEVTVRHESVQGVTTAKQQAAHVSLGDKLDCNGKKNGFYSRDCVKTYVYCENGSAITMNCPHDLVFNERKVQCDYLETWQTDFETSLATPTITFINPAPTVQVLIPVAQKSFDCKEKSNGYYSLRCTPDYVACVEGVATAMRKKSSLRLFGKLLKSASSTIFASYLHGFGAKRRPTYSIAIDIKLIALERRTATNPKVAPPPSYCAMRE